MSVTRLQVTYKSPEVDEELDRKILEFFNKLSFVCVNRDYNHLTWERRLDFERHTGANVLESKDAFDARKSKEIEEEVVGKHASKRDKEIKLKA